MEGEIGICSKRLLIILVHNVFFVLVIYYLSKYFSSQVLQ